MTLKLDSLTVSEITLICIRSWSQFFLYKSPVCRNAFAPLHSTSFTEELLEAHEAEASRMKEYYNLHCDLFKKVSQRQEVWNKFMELERRAKDPSRFVIPSLENFFFFSFSSSGWESFEV